MPATPTGLLESVEAKVSALGKTGALNEETLIEVEDIFGEVSARIKMIQRILTAKISELKAEKAQS